jgi:3-methyladenine DNA glycosylase AlkD
MSIKNIRSKLDSLSKASKSNSARFFKTTAGSYSEHDQFINVPNPELRLISKEYKALSFLELEELMKSKINEERLLSLFILIHQFPKNKEACYHFYLKHIAQVNNWNLVDASAHLICGTYLIDKDKSLLFELAESQNMWERRIAIVSTWWFIRKNKPEWTYQIAIKLLNDSQDLIHKAVGWMLREAGKKNQQVLIKFLDAHWLSMPRTMLRSAIEKLSEDLRKEYLKR